MDAPAKDRSPPIDLGSEETFRVGAAVVDPLSREARFEAGSERLQPQNLKVLIALTRGKGRVVTREQLIDLCWDGRFVGDDVINRSISTLRQFAERAGGFRIETVPRAGYRLVEARSSRATWWRPMLIGALAAAIAAAALLAAWLLAGRSSSPGSERTPTIALLQFTTASTDPAVRQLATTIHDSVGHMLSQTQFHVRLIDAGGRAGSDDNFLITGNVGTAQGKIMVTVRMEETAYHTIVYSQRFEAPLETADSLVDQVGGQVAGSIGWTVPLLMLDRQHRSDPTITAELFRKVDIQGVDQLSLYEAARRLAARSPDSALAHIELAFGAAFALPELPRDQREEALAIGRRAQERARALAPRFGEPFIGWCLLRSSARIGDCEDNLRQAMRTDPDSPFVTWYLAGRLMDAGRFNDSLDLAKQSLAHDQYVPEKILLTLRLLEATGQPAEADNYYREVKRWWPSYKNIVWARVSGMIDHGNYAGIERFEKEVGKEGWPDGYEELAPAAVAARTHSLSGARKACPVAGGDTLKSLFCMSVLAEVGDLDGAFALAERLYPRRLGRTPAEEQSIWLDKPFVNGTEYFTGPGAAAMRRDPRYLALAERVGLLAYWRSGRLPDFCRPPRAEPVCRQLGRA
ncbi:MAG TPA: winged helix-turn-helix domain-containing protein [Sphingomicrobium sp.]|nr:winged helix-turn-helix domain-containing protein [Sphingomicrobium sp.]